MKKVIIAFARWRNIQAEIKDKKTEIKEIEKSVYYGGIAPEWHRARDLNEAQGELKDLLDKEFSTLETLQQMIELHKSDNQTEKRDLILANVKIQQQLI